MRVLTLSIIGFAAALGMGGLTPGVAQTTAGPAASTPGNAAAQGKRVFIRCASCHAIGGGAGGARIGPNLAGVVGRKAGNLPGVTYSAAMKQQSFAWTEAMLDKWLTRPSSVVPGTSMAFAGLPKREDRAAVIAYLKNPVK